MTRLAQDRIADLFALAEAESRVPGSPLPSRYSILARRIGMRYNVRLLPEYRDLYCRGCSAYWVEGRTVRTRLRSGRRVRTCLVCGRVRRVKVHPERPGVAPPEAEALRPIPTEESALVGEAVESDEAAESDEGEDG